MNRRQNGRPAGAGAIIPEQAGSYVSLAASLEDPFVNSPELPGGKRNGLKAGTRRDPLISRDMLYTVHQDGSCHIISEDYSYKSETYYSILRQEMTGRPVRPASAAVLDAYVVPVCLERAHLAGIPVCTWGISQGYAPLPSLVYGLNYFASAADYAVVRDSEKAKEIIKHITNKGKYPFCYQKLEDDAEIGTCISIFGRTTDNRRGISELARQVYELFAIPLVTIVSVRYGDRFLLSSLSPAKYSRLSAAERTLLTAYLSHQEFL